MRPASNAILNRFFSRFQMVMGIHKSGSSVIAVIKSSVGLLPRAMLLLQRGAGAQCDWEAGVVGGYRFGTVLP